MVCPAFDDYEADASAKSFALPQCMRAQEWRRNRRAEEKLDVVENAEIPAAAPPVARRDGQVKAT